MNATEQRICDAMQARLGPLYEVHGVRITRIPDQQLGERVEGYATRGHTNSWSFVSSDVAAITPDVLAFTIDQCAKFVEQLYAKNANT